MVKVKDEPAMAEPNSATSPQPPACAANTNPSPPTSYLPRKPRVPHAHIHHHHHPPQFQHYTYYHQCTSYPSENADAAGGVGGGTNGGATSPARFYFGPGFEPQQQYAGNGGFGPGPGPNQGSEYVVFFHVNPGVTISFQMGDNLEILRGAVRAESFTRLPPPLHPASMTDSHMTSGDSTECVPEATPRDDADSGDDLDEDSEELLQRLATRHYYSYTAALGVTVGVGCLLLVLNMLIFAGIYYQREKDRKRQDQTRSRRSRSNSTPSTETIPMSQRPSTPGSSAKQSPVGGKKERHEMPPCYTMLSRADSPLMPSQNTLKKEKPPPPVRSSSNPSGTVKKRVQIQEISV